MSPVLLEPLATLQSGVLIQSDLSLVVGGQQDVSFYTLADHIHRGVAVLKSLGFIAENTVVGGPLDVAEFIGLFHFDDVLNI